MTPAARVQAAIEVLDLVIEAARRNGPPADRIVSDWFRTRRFAGSGDRRAVRELAYRAIRACGEVPENGRTAMLLLAQDDPALTGLFDGSRFGPAVISPEEPVALPGIAPQHLMDELARSGIDADEAAHLSARASLDIRVNSLKAVRDGLELPVAAEATAAPHGLRLPLGTVVEQWPAYLQGKIEVQDTASQLACQAVGAMPGETVIDLCAGAGGKTLALAADMDNRGTLLACDTDRDRLSRLVPRADRAGASLIETRLLNPGRELEALEDFRERAQVVLVDAPCSGTGTWRRNPEARWRLRPADLERYCTVQARLLDVASALVAPGGRLFYATCSLLDREGADQVTAFLARHHGWQAVPIDLPLGRARGQGHRLSPGPDGTDGFFIAHLHRAC